MKTLLALLAMTLIFSGEVFGGINTPPMRDPSGIGSDIRLSPVPVPSTVGPTILSSYSGSYALLIGESQYAYRWTNLSGIPGELQKVEAMLTAQGFQVETALNLTSSQLRERVDKFINDYGFDENNRLLFFYSGHGYSRGPTDNKKGYIVPIDAPNPDFDMKGFLQKAVTMNQFMTWARRMEAKHALFLFDSCFAGTVFAARENMTLPRQISQAAARPVRQFITAGRADEKVPAKSTFTPAFVDALAEGWGDLNQDGYITGRELGLYLWNKVPKYTEQTPQFGEIRDYHLAQGDFVFVVGNGGSQPISNVLATMPAGKVFRDRLKDGTEGPEMVVIPAGRFRMGDIQGGGRDNEQPVHSVSVDKLAMGRYEVTVAEFRRFVNATGYQTDAEKKGGCYSYANGWKWVDGADWRNFGISQTDNHPVVCVSWNDATAYTKWLSEQTGHTYRLPTEAEWEYAARAGTETKYWWGNTASHEYANYGKDVCCDGFAKGKDRWVYTSPVGSFAKNPFGLYDTVGNVWEWTCSEYEGKYAGKEQQCADAGYFVLRGGAWNGDAARTRSADRYCSDPTNRFSNCGFRPCRG